MAKKSIISNLNLLIFLQGDNSPKTQMGETLSFVVVKKDRQQNYYTLAYKKYMLQTFYQTYLQKRRG